MELKKGARMFLDGLTLLLCTMIFSGQFGISLPIYSSIFEPHGILFAATVAVLSKTLTISLIGLSSFTMVSGLYLLAKYVISHRVIFMYVRKTNRG